MFYQTENGSLVDVMATIRSTVNVENVLNEAPGFDPRMEERILLNNGICDGQPPEEY